MLSGVISGSANSSGSFDVTVTVDDGNDGSASVRFVWAIFDADEQPGLSYAYYQGAWNALPNFPALTPVETGSIATFNLSQRNRDDYFAFRFEGQIRILTGGVFTFYTSSDDGSRLWIDGTLVVDNDGLHGTEEEEGTISLTSGDHDILVEYFEKTGSQTLTVSYAGPGIAKQAIPAGVLFQPRSVFVHHPGNQIGIEGASVSVQIDADTTGASLTFSASGLPANTGIDPSTGLITGSLAVGSSGSYGVTVTADDGSGNSDSVSFTWTVTSAPSLALDPIVSPPQQVGLPIDYLATVTGGVNPEFEWLFGDGTPETPSDPSPTVSHTFSQPGRYVVTLTVTDDAGETVATQFVQAIHEPPTTNRPALSMSLVYEQRAGNDRLWVVNPDNDTVTVFDAQSYTKVAEIPVGVGPRALAQAPDGTLWVTNKNAATISIVDPNTLSVVQTVVLPPRSQPYGVAFDPNGAHGYVTLEASGELLRLNPATGADSGSVAVGPNPRHLSIAGDGATIYVSRYITPPVPGEGGAAPDVWSGGGEIVVVTSGMVVANTMVLAHSDRQDAEHSGRGLPNYLGPAVIAPDGLSAWVPSKQDNVLRGTLRDGRNLTHDSTVRSISSRLDLQSETEDTQARIDHDDGGIASTGLFGRYGSYLFIALEGSRQVVVIDPYGNEEIARFDAGRAPQGLALSPDGLTLYVHNFMDRTVSVHDVSAIVDEGGGTVTTLATMDAVASEQLSSEVLLGKQLFYDARDPRLAFQNYISCASCHNDGAQDGRVWDLTGFGEGLRNTIDLRGRAGIGHGPLHWSANFDEVQDFEGQIRDLSGGSGLMSDADFNAGTRDEPLGDPKAGISPDLDALAAYVASLLDYALSPLRTAAGTLTSEGVAGRAVFESQHCAKCHSGGDFSDSGAGGGLHDIGTITTNSGGRLGGPLPGLDTPTLRSVWATGPYLHDGSATGLAEAILAHSGVSLATTDLDRLVAYLEQIDGDEPPPMPNAPPTGRLETVVVDGVSSSGWTPVSLTGSYQSMVAVCSLASMNNAAPAVVRLRNAQGSGFDVRLQNPSGEALVGKQVSCLVSSAGAWTLPDGRKLEAHVLESTVTGFKGHFEAQWMLYQQSYTNPVVFGQVMTYNDADWSTFFSRGARRSDPPSAGVLGYGKHVGEDPDTTRNTETIGVIVLEAGSGTLGTVAYEVALGADSIEGGNRTFSYPLTGFGSTPEFALITQAGMDDGNGGWAVLAASEPSSMSEPSPMRELRLFIEEDQLADAEQWHTTEQVSYLVLAAGIDVVLDPVAAGAAASLTAPASTLAMAAAVVDEPDDPGDLAVFEAGDYQVVA